MALTWESLVQELKALRQRQGLTLRALAGAPAVLAALGNVPIQEAHDRLIALIDELGDNDRVYALKNAYAIDHANPETLMTRRAQLQSVTGRDPKTIASYENAMIEELARRLVGSEPTELSDSQVYVVGYVEGLHISRILVTVRFPVEDPTNIRERTVEYENRSDAQSMPALIYQLPQKWLPRELILAVHFSRPPFPARVWASAARGLRDLMFSDNGQQLPLSEERFVNIQVVAPKPDALYSIYWTL